MTRPDFFMVGAPRCGTTWLYQNLRDHPGVFMPRYKEMDLFCPDVRYRKPAWRRTTPDRSTFERRLADAPTGAVIGSACTRDLFSAAAPGLIHELNPRASIIVQLRDPVEALYSLWSLRRTADDERRSLARALTDEDAEVATVASATVASASTAATAEWPRLFADWYTRLYRYGDQLPRYLDRFGRSKVHVVVFEDMVRDPARAYAGVLEHLGLVPQPPVRETAANPNAVVRSRTAVRLLFAGPTIAAAKRVVPASLHGRAARFADTLNERLRKPTARVPMDPELRSELVERFRPDVRRLSDLLGRDLEALWFGSGV